MTLAPLLPREKGQGDEAFVAEGGRGMRLFVKRGGGMRLLLQKGSGDEANAKRRGRGMRQEEPGEGAGG